MRKINFNSIFLVFFILVSAFCGYKITEYLILFYEYGIVDTFSRGIHFVEHKPYLVTNVGDTFSRWHNLFLFLFTIIPVVFVLVVFGALLDYLSNGRLFPKDEEKEAQAKV